MLIRGGFCCGACEEARREVLQAGEELPHDGLMDSHVYPLCQRVCPICDVVVCCNPGPWRRYQVDELPYHECVCQHIRPVGLDLLHCMAVDEVVLLDTRMLAQPP